MIYSIPCPKCGDTCSASGKAPLCDTCKAKHSYVGKKPKL